MHRAGAVLDYNLSLFARGSENEIRMVDTIFLSISHSDQEWLKRGGVK